MSADAFQHRGLLISTAGAFALFLFELLNGISLLNVEVVPLVPAIVAFCGFLFVLNLLVYLTIIANQKSTARQREGVETG